VRLDELVEVRTIDYDTSQRSSLPRTCAGPKWWQLHDGDETLQHIVADGPEAATEVLRGLTHVQ
jgi:hypothetical protein